MQTVLLLMAAASFFSGWEIVLVLTVLLILVGVRAFGSGRPEEVEKSFRALAEDLMLWVAQGLGIGRIPFAPGTFGSALGLLWFLLLLASGNFWLFAAAILLSTALSVWLCGAAEEILGEKDPPSVVLDEIIALPVCFLPWVASDWFRKGQMPAPEFFFNHQNWHVTLIIFLLFRAFDILKPWPVRQSQALPGGWGVVIDDLLAATYVALLTLLVIR